MRVYVELAGNIDVSAWQRRNSEGTAPDETPYGLHRMESDDTVVAFRSPLASPAALRLSRRVSGRARGLEIVHAMATIRDKSRRTADVVLAMDERAGLPAVWVPGGAPVVSGLAWLEDPDDLDAAYRRIVVASTERLAGAFTMCSAMVEPLTRKFGIRPERMHVVPFGVDERHFAAQPWPAEPGTVFSVGDDPMRDHRTLVDSVTLLRDHGVDVRLSLATLLPVVVPEDVGVVHRRRMDAAVRDQYAAASVVAVALQPTRQGSGLSVILEAMASGRPVVATANPGLDMYVEHGATGFLVPAGDPGAMAHAIRRLLDDPDMARAMGQAARERVEERFTSAHMAQALRGVVRRVAQERAEARANRSH